MIRILIISAVFPVMVCSCCRQKLLDEYIINNNEVNNNEEIPYPEIQEPYVGAFWKANETGERLIRMNVEEDKSIESNGSWEVEISSGDSDGLNADEVMLAELPAGYSKYQGVKVNAGIAQISESEAKTSLSGTGDVAFRIGLKSALS